MTSSLIAAISLSAIAAAHASVSTPAHGGEAIEFRSFGATRVYRPSGEPSAVVLLATGALGFDRDIESTAAALVEAGVMVVAFETRKLVANADAYKTECVNLAVDIEALSHFIQLKLGLARYHEPVLAGVGEGAALAYAAAAQAAPSLVRALATVGPVSRSPLSKKSLCKGHGLVTAAPVGRGAAAALVPSAALVVPWRAVATGSASERAELARFTQAAKAATIIDVAAPAASAKKPEAAAKELEPAALANSLRRALGDAIDASKPVAAALPPAVKDLPVEEVPPPKAGSRLAIIISGDGGWAGIDKSLCQELVANDVACVGLNSLHYFWQRKSPETGAADLARIMRHYMSAWNRSEVILVGYSFGADVLPFFYSLLPEELRRQTATVALLGPTERASFQFHVTDWLTHPDSGTPTAPQIEAITDTHVLCVYGSDEKSSPCPALHLTHGRTVMRPGGHHFDGDYRALARLLLEQGAKP